MNKSSRQERVQLYACSFFVTTKILESCPHYCVLNDETENEDYVKSKW